MSNNLFWELTIKTPWPFHSPTPVCMSACVGVLYLFECVRETRLVYSCLLCCWFPVRALKQNWESIKLFVSLPVRMCGLTHATVYVIMQLDLSPLLFLLLKYTALGQTHSSWIFYPSPYSSPLASWSPDSLFLILLILFLHPPFFVTQQKQANNPPSHHWPFLTLLPPLHQLPSSAAGFACTHTHPHRKQMCRGVVCSGQGQGWPLRLCGRAESWWWETCPKAVHGSIFCSLSM